MHLHPSLSSMNNGTRVAAVDLGSNSFRLEIGTVENGQFYRSEYLKETVRQGGGLDEYGNLTLDAMQRGWDCLARFGERLTGFTATEVCAVATQTLREAHNRDVFLNQGCKALGFPIDVISGPEEARLIYQGVIQALPPANERRLVIDIGGRSTEIILGQNLTPLKMDSHLVGSIDWSTRYFSDKQFSKKAFQQAEVAAKSIFEDTYPHYQRQHWDTAYGSAGTINAIGEILQAGDWPKGKITREGLDWLMEKLLTAKNTDLLHLAGLKEDRKPIIGGGLSVLRAIFSLLNIETLQLAYGGLRHGILQDLIGHGQQGESLKHQSVQRLISKFDIDTQQGERIERVAHLLYKQLHSSTSPAITEPLKSEQTLSWAAKLHEIGVQIAHNDYHKHGAYIIDNADVMGFSLTELHKLSLLILGQRGKLRKVDTGFNDPVFIKQLLCLRLAVALCHARNDPQLNSILLSQDNNNSFICSYSAAWAKNFPQSVYLLNEESNLWKKTPRTLNIFEY